MSDSKQQKGGLARAVSLSPQRKVEIAREAARQRWQKKKAVDLLSVDYDALDDAGDDVLPIDTDPPLPVAQWRGTLNLVGVDVPCYVLDNGQKVIGRTSATETLTGIKGGGALEKYIAVKALEPFINKNLVLERLVAFRLPEVDGLDRAVKGLPADLMIELCQGFVAALQSSFDPHSSHPKLTDRQREMAIKASMFLSACAKVGLEALIDEATGYQYERAEDALQVKLRAFIAEELRDWEKTFPDSLWLEFGRLTGWATPLRNRPKWWGKLVIEMIYDTLDPDVADYLKTNKPVAGVHWHRQLTENYGVRQLVSRCHEVVGMAKDCKNIRELRDKVAFHYGRRPIQITMYLDAPSKH